MVCPKVSFIRRFHCSLHVYTLQMHKGMIHGSDITVEPASTENGYVELPPEAASNPWSQIAAGRDLKGCFVLCVCMLELVLTYFQILR